MKKTAWKVVLQLSQAEIDDPQEMSRCVKNYLEPLGRCHVSSVEPINRDDLFSFYQGAEMMKKVYVVRGYSENNSGSWPVAVFSNEDAADKYAAAATAEAKRLEPERLSTRLLTDRPLNKYDPGLPMVATRSWYDTHWMPVPFNPKDMK